MEVKAKLRYARIGAQKARLMADLIRGRNVNEAMAMLTLTHKKSSVIVRKLLQSAVANAQQKKVVDIDNLYVKTIFVDQGPSLNRFMPRARGSASPIRKKMSHINLVLDER